MITHQGWTRLCNIWQGAACNRCFVQGMAKLLVRQPSPTPCHFLHRPQKLWKLHDHKGTYSLTGQMGQNTRMLWIWYCLPLRPWSCPSRRPVSLPGFGTWKGWQALIWKTSQTHWWMCWTKQCWLLVWFWRSWLWGYPWFRFHFSFIIPNQTLTDGPGSLEGS